MLSVVSLILFLSLIEVHSQSFPYVSFMNKTLANNSYVNFGLVDDGSDSVQCHTDLTTCCNQSQGSHRGDWFFPNGNRLPFHSIADIHESRNDRKVDLRRKTSTSPSGIYRCDMETVASQNKTMARETVFVGLYADGGSVVWLKNCSWLTKYSFIHLQEMSQYLVA